MGKNKGIYPRGNIYHIKYSNGKSGAEWKMIPESTKQQGHDGIWHDGKDLTWAEQLLKIRIGEVAAGKLIAPERTKTELRFSDYYDNTFKPNYVEQQKTATIVSYELAFKYLKKHFGSMKMKDVTPAMVNDFLSALATGKILGIKGDKLAKNYIYSIHSHAKTMYRWAITERDEPGIIRNPFSGHESSYKKAKKKKDFDYLRVHEVPIFMNAIQEQSEEDYAFFAVAIGTGGRDGELRALQIGDLQLGDEETLRLHRFISFRRQVLRDGSIDVELKTDSSKRTVPLSKELVAILQKRKARLLKEWIASGKDEAGFYEAWLFPNNAGKPMDDKNIKTRVFKPALQAAGLRDMTFHCLRHTFASLLLNSRKATLQEVSRWLGHSSIRVTADIYGHLELTTNAEAVNSIPSFTMKESKKILTFQKD